MEFHAWGADWEPLVLPKPTVLESPRHPGRAGQKALCVGIILLKYFSAL